MGERTKGVLPGNINETLGELFACIEQRQRDLPEGSYTTRLLTEPIDYTLKKLVEEATELVLAVKDGDHDHIRYEAADVFYHLLVLLKRAGISLEELAGELNARKH